VYSVLRRVEWRDSWLAGGKAPRTEGEVADSSVASKGDAVVESSVARWGVDLDEGKVEKWVDTRVARSTGCWVSTRGCRKASPTAAERAGWRAVDWGGGWVEHSATKKVVSMEQR
jgi:hypothetical protein